MDDVLLFTLTKKSYIAKLQDLLKALLKNGLKISPKKWLLFRKEVQYMGNTIFIKDRWVCVGLLQRRLDAIQKLKPPVTFKFCRNGKFLKYILSWITEVIKAHIWFNQER